jgi:Ca2+/Na+ antiporter
MVGITLLLTVFILWPRKTRQLSKVEGGLLLSCYVAYLVMLYRDTVQV